MSLWINQHDRSIWDDKALQVNKHTGLVVVNHTVVWKHHNYTKDICFVIASLIGARPLLFYVPWFSKWKKRSCKESTMTQTSVINLSVSWWWQVNSFGQGTNKCSICIESQAYATTLEHLNNKKKARDTHMAKLCSDLTPLVFWRYQENIVQWTIFWVL